MSNLHNDGDRIDLDLLKKIELMRPTPERDEGLASKGRERFLAELESLPIAEDKSLLAKLRIPLIFKSDQSKELSMNTRPQKLALSSIFAIVFAFILLFGGFSATAYASQSALPGDALFTVKTSIESTQVRLARDEYAKAQLQMRFAQRRLEEITLLLEQGRLKDVDLASSEFETYIQNALNSLELVMAGDPQRGAELSNQISQALLNYALALKNVLVEAPDAVKPVVEKAFLLSQESAGDELEVVGVVESISDSELVVDGETYLISDLSEFESKIEAGDAVKIHVIITAEGMKIIREVEAISSFDDSSVEDESADDNANENQDNQGSFGSDNSNANEDDDNDNSSEDAISNANDNEDDSNDNNDNSGNDNDDDHGNDNRSDNSNDNDDDHSNDNSGSDDGSNVNNHEEDDHGNENEIDDD